MSTAVARRLAPANEAIGTKKPDNPIARFRPGELYRLMAVRYGRRLPPNDDGARFRDRMLDTLVLSGMDGRRRAANFLAFRCPWMSAAARAAAMEVAFRTRRYWSAEALGNDLDVTEAEHAKARIRTFRVAGMSDAAMKAKRQAKDAARKREERLRERLRSKTKTPKPARRVGAILDLLPKDDWWSVTAVVNQLERAKTFAFAGLGKGTGSLRPAVHRAIKQGVEEGRLQARKVPGSKMSEAMEIRRGPRA
ncbi:MULTISPECIES: hypothetical protein [unclassified Bradyrhizobium]|uniref:hypothetical protein n=1 Tax=unclassified Bradyrhizobium TaxID=2631580 RepID=UPI0029160710|nr:MULTISPECIES: hypothetical protein [unclassified Bradyrhizobium]